MASAEIEVNMVLGWKRPLHLFLISIAAVMISTLVGNDFVNADTGGARLKIVNPTISGSSVVDVVGRGFGAGEVVSLYVTFPDGRVFPIVNAHGSASPPGCCEQTDQVLADGTGGFSLQFVFGDISNDVSTSIRVLLGQGEDTDF